MIAGGGDGKKVVSPYRCSTATMSITMRDRPDGHTPSAVDSIRS